MARTSKPAKPKRKPATKRSQDDGDNGVTPVPKAEAEFLAGYRPGRYPRPSVTVDIVLLTVRDTDLKVLLIERGEPPYRGYWALPGGFVRVAHKPGDQGEDLVDAAHRELSEETGLPAHSARLEQLATFGAPGRDPRMRVISVAYTALLRPELANLVEAGTDAAAACWVSLASELPELQLAFDHRAILQTALARMRSRVDRSAIAFELVPRTFTIAELRAVYEAIVGHEYDAGNFRRRFLRMQTDGIIEQAPGKRHTASKPARVYRFVQS